MHVVITLAEGDYLFGAAVLYNSLVQNGFNGRFIIGFRNSAAFPNGLQAQMQALPPELPGIEWIELNTSWHFTNYKARFMLDILGMDPAIEKVTYLDPDIVINCPWSWMNSWCESGPVVFSDVNWMLPRLHPTRRSWSDLIAQDGEAVHQELDLYFNGGCVSVQRSDGEFIALWHHIIERYGSLDMPLDGKGDINQWRTGGRWNLLQTPDQDALNIAAMAWKGGLSVFGPDAMGFTGGWCLIPHALGSNKPWRKRFLRDALGGSPPRFVDKLFWSYINQPVAVFPRMTQNLRCLSIAIGAAIGRFYSRR